MVEPTQEQKENEFLQHTLSGSLLDTLNFYRLFKLYRSVPNIGGYLMDQFIERAHVQVFIVLYKTCQPNLATEFIMKELEFGIDEEFNRFIVEQKANTSKTNNDQLLDTRLALVEVVESQKKYKRLISEVKCLVMICSNSSSVSVTRFGQSEEREKLPLKAKGRKKTAKSTSRKGSKSQGSASLKNNFQESSSEGAISSTHMILQNCSGMKRPVYTKDSQEKVEDIDSHQTTKELVVNLL